MIPKKSESKYVSALPKIINGPSLLKWQSAMSSIIFGPFRLLGNAHLFNWLFWWPVGVDMWCLSCRPEVRIRRRVREKIPRISNLLKMFEVWTLSNSNANFVTSLVSTTVKVYFHHLSTMQIKPELHSIPLHVTDSRAFWISIKFPKIMYNTRHNSASCKKAACHV